VTTELTPEARLEGTLVAALRQVSYLGSSVTPWAIEIETKCGRVVHLVCRYAGGEQPPGAASQALICHDGPFLGSGHLRSGIREVRDLTAAAAVAFANRPRVIALGTTPHSAHRGWALTFDTGASLHLSATDAGPRLHTEPASQETTAAQETRS
jgi:hypothetical protein